MRKSLINFLVCLLLASFLCALLPTGVMAVNPSIPNYSIIDNSVQQTPQSTNINTNQIQNLRIQNFITQSDGTRAVVLKNGKTYPIQDKDIFGALISVEPAPASQIPEIVAKQLNKIPPATVDLRRWHTPIRDQSERYTCVSFATLAAVEAMYKRLNPIKYANIDLSEQYVNHVQKMVSLSEDPVPIADFRENQHGAWGGSNPNYLVRLFTSWYSIPPENLLPYIPGASYENTNEPDDNPQIDWRDQSVKQRVINDFNLDPGRWSVDTIKGATYGIASYCSFPKSKLNDIHYYKSVLAAGFDIIFNIKIMSPDPNPNNDIWQPGTVEEGTHAMTMVGYDEERQVFIVKNSWGYDNPAEKGFTLVSFDYITGGYVEEAVYITAIREDTTTLHSPEQLFLGRWKMDHNGKKGILDIFRLPHFYEWPSGKEDLRIGTYFDQNGNAYRVNGSIDPNKHKLDFYIDFIYRSQNYHGRKGQKFTAYLFTRDPMNMAGEYVETDGKKYGFYATKENYYSSAPVPGEINKSSYLGTWQINHDGWPGRLEIEFVDSSGKLKGMYYAQDGKKHNVSGTVAADGRSIVLEIQFEQSHRQKFFGYINTREPGIITGVTVWNGNNYGFFARRIGGISVNAPTNLTAKPLSTTAITLKWQDNSDNETGFVIARKSPGSPYYVNIARTDADSTIVIDSGLTKGETYSYRVKAIKGAVSSAYSNEASAKTKDPIVIDQPKQTIPGPEPKDPIVIDTPKITIPGSQPQDPIIIEKPKITIPKL